MGTVHGFRAAGEAGAVCGAGLPSGGHGASHRPTPSELRTVSPSPSSHDFPETPQQLRAPPPTGCHGDHLYTVSSSPFLFPPPSPSPFLFPPPSPSPCPKSGRSPPAGRREPEGAGRGPMNSTAPGRLVIGRVKFFRRHRGEVRPGGPARALGSWFPVRSSNSRMGSRF